MHFICKLWFDKNEYLTLTELWLTFSVHMAVIYAVLLAFSLQLQRSSTRARVAEFEASVRDLDWQQVSEISLDVAKLKKAAQKWQNNSNALEKTTQKDLLERAYMERLMQQSPTVQQIRKVEM